ncbi:MAG: 50S ribosomal protein L4 [Candidatus Dadabacteria bacterium]|nr:MAG: 50S ribosomal protein L4 [Candidatus Dadabacteria bacterium]
MNWQIVVKNIQGEEVGKVEVRVSDLRGAETSELTPRVWQKFARCIHETVLWQRAKRRSGTHKVKTRGELAHSDRKPWRQKKTGRARAGTKNSPLWRGGGIVHGPVPRDYSYKLPKKVRKIALLGSLIDRINCEKVVVVDALRGLTGKTKDGIRFLDCLGINRGERVLVVCNGEDAVIRSLRNIPWISLIEGAYGVNTYDLLRNEILLIQEEDFHKLLRRVSVGSSSEEKQAA